MQSSVQKHQSLLLQVATVVALNMFFATSIFLFYPDWFASRTKAQPVDETPPGTVSAFNLSACPDGWSEFYTGRGRTIIGVNPTSGGGLSARTLLSTGGTETHTLSIAEMAAHGHLFTTFDIYDTNSAFTINDNSSDAIASTDNFGAWGAWQYNVHPTAAQGGGGAHNNMPPFVALLYCQKYDPATPPEVPLYPSGAVVHFDLDTCPVGWNEFTPARGRALLGTNPTQFVNTGNEGNISVRTLGSMGGAESHTLTLAEMPSHNHTGTTTDPVGSAFARINTSAAMAGGGFGVLTDTTSTRWAVGQRSTVGTDQPHNNMKPFLTQLTCKKE